MKIKDLLQKKIDGQRETTSSEGTSASDQENHFTDTEEEDLESETLRTLQDEFKSLPISLKLQVIEWMEAFLAKRDKLHHKESTLKNLVDSKQPPKSAILKCELNSSEHMKEVFKDVLATEI